MGGVGCKGRIALAHAVGRSARTKTATHEECKNMLGVEIKARMGGATFVVADPEIVAGATFAGAPVWHIPGVTTQVVAGTGDDRSRAVRIRKMLVKHLRGSYVAMIG
jgi:hypothetical protein